MNERLVTGEDKECLYVLPRTIVDNGGSWQDGAMIMHFYGDKSLSVKHLHQLRAHHIKTGILGYVQPSVATKFQSCCVLLTVYATESRKSMYLRRLEWWRASGLPVYLVCSKGDGHMGDHPNTLSFSQDQPEATTNPSATERAAGRTQWISSLSP